MEWIKIGFMKLFWWIEDRRASVVSRKRSDSARWNNNYFELFDLDPEADVSVIEAELEEHEQYCNKSPWRRRDLEELPYIREVMLNPKKRKKEADAYILKQKEWIAGPRRKNYFGVLELNPSDYNPDEIETKINEMEQRWKDSAVTDWKYRYYLEEIPNIRAVMLTPEKCKVEAAKAAAAETIKKCVKSMEGRISHKGLEIVDKNNHTHIVKGYTSSWEYYSSNDSPHDARTHEEERILCESVSLGMRFDSSGIGSYEFNELQTNYDKLLLAEVLSACMQKISTK